MTAAEMPKQISPDVNHLTTEYMEFRALTMMPPSGGRFWVPDPQWCLLICIGPWQTFGSRTIADTKLCPPALGWVVADRLDGRG